MKLCCVLLWLLNREPRSPFDLKCRAVFGKEVNNLDSFLAQQEDNTETLIQPGFTARVGALIQCDIELSRFSVSGDFMHTMGVSAWRW